MSESAGDTPLEAIARDILRIGVAGRLPTTTEYQNRLGIGSGTVQKAFRDLRGGGAVGLVSRGHQGTFVTEMDTARLWAAARLAPVHVLLPPSSPAESVSIAGGVADVFAGSGATTTIGLVGGAAARLAAVDTGEADIAVMSAGAAEDLVTAGSGRLVLPVGPGTYYAPGSLVVVGRRDLPSRPRIGIDPASDDHQRLTHAQFPADEHTYVTTDFPLVPRALVHDEIDAGVWHIVDTLIPLEAVGLSITPLSRPGALALAEHISGAVLVTREDSIPGILLSRLPEGRLREVCAPRAERSPTAEALRIRVR
ncbi:YhfZ family protein [Streptomyces sp. RFCAC02]|uniref:YhfZ family protein n=1 Tax=Streptomyces sp. RFCAC02 TaxID=2499143 RepID=UPI001020855F|nr:YhfZ family protein [Streptomyces sp. RFCAC02]